MHPALTVPRSHRFQSPGKAALAAVFLAATLPAASNFKIAGKKDLPIDPSAGISILVANSGDAAGNATLSGTVAPGEAGCAFTPQPTTAVIGPSSEAWLRLTFTNPNPCAPGSYPARIVVTGSAEVGDYVVQVPKIQAPKTWKAIVYRSLPFTAWYLSDRFEIPVQIPKFTAPPSAAILILPREAGASLFGSGWVTLKLAPPQNPTAAPSVTRLSFQVEGGGQAGKYSGDVSLPGADPTKLELAVKDMALWPLLVILSSVLLTLKIQRYVSVKRPALDWQRRTAQTAANLQLATAGASFGYDISADFTIQRNQLDIDATTFGSLKNPSAAEQNRIEAAVARLELIPHTWTDFIRTLQQLQGALGALPASLTTPPPDAVRIGQTEPRSVANAHSLLAGAPLTLEAWRAVSVKLASTSALLSTLLPLAQQVSLYAATPGLPPALQLLIDQATSKLWRAGAADDLQRLAIPADLDNIAGQLLALGRPVLVAAGAAPPVAGAAALPSMQPFELPEVTARRIARRIAGTDGKLALLAIAIAVLLGLRDYYFDSAFGTLKDYAGLVIYGTGTKLAIDLVHTSLQSLLGRQSAV